CLRTACGMRRRKLSEPERRAEPQFDAATAYSCRGAVSRRASRGHQARRLDSRAMAQADLTRERLVRAALELFTAQGYHDTTTPAIAKKAGVAEGTIYRHFAGKQQFFNELYRA